MINFLKDSLTLIFRSGISLTVLLAVVLIGGYAIGRLKPPYVISMRLYEKEGSQPDCDQAAIELMKEEIRVYSYEYAASTNSLKTRSSDFSLRISTALNQKTFLDVVSDGNSLLMALQEFVGSAPQVISIFLRVEKGKCLPIDAVLIFQNTRKFIPFITPNELMPIAREVVNTIDDFIPIAKLAFSYNTVEESRNQSFTKISEGKQTKWYKNLVAFTYLQETDIFDPILNRKIILKRLDQAEYWVSDSLKEDRNFLPALINRIYIGIEKDKHSILSYERSIEELLKIHYRSGCGECLSRAAQLRLNRYGRMQDSRTQYRQSNEDLSRSREYLEYKINHYGPDQETYIS